MAKPDESREWNVGMNKNNENNKNEKMDIIDNRLSKNKREERVCKSDRTYAQNKRKEPCKITYLNAQGLVNEETKWKLEASKEYAGTNNVIIMNITETWLNKEKQDDKIPNFTTFRSDRKSKIKTKGGGTAIYVKDGFEAKLILEDYEESSEIVAVYIENLNLVNIVIYRPPKTLSKDFEIIMNKTKKLLSEMEIKEPTIIITGDFNFPFIKWKRGTSNACDWKDKTDTYGKIDDQKQFKTLMKVMDEGGLTQVVEEPTRKGNTLDLVFTNYPEMFTQIDVTKTNMSDHNIIELTTVIEDRDDLLKGRDSNPHIEENDLRQLNFHHEKVNWTQMKEVLLEMPWKEIFDRKNNEECTEIFIYVIQIICFLMVPKKSNKSKPTIPRERKTMLSRIKMLKRNKHREKNKNKVKIIEDSIIETEKRLLEHRKNERNSNEERVIKNIKENPKIFYDYIRNQRYKDSKIGPFKIENEYVYDTKEICRILIEQYNSQFSKRSKPNKNTEEELKDISEGDLIDIEFSEVDIANAINNLKKNSAAGPDGIPAIFLINTKDSIKSPLQIILRRGLDEGVVPDVLKLAYVTPIHKGDSKMNPENYRPISLTSHIMKIFERVIKVHLVRHMEKHCLLKKNQHGFVSGRSTQTQLLQH